MSLLGYTEKEISNVIEDLWNIKPNCPPEFLPGLEIAIDFLEGMIAEGKI